MFFKYPYTDMYTLNLDWMLQAIREVQEIIGALGSVVNSVNGESGDVVISDAMINAAGVGVLQTYSDPTTIDDLTQAQLLSLYDNGKRILIFRNNLNVFDRVYFLQKNGSTVSAVYYDPGSFMAGVRSINGLSGDILLNAANLPVNDLPDAPYTGTVINGIQQDIGDTTDLETTAHVLVNAINELLGALNIESIARVDGDNAVFAELAETVALLLTVDENDIAEETISVGQYVYFDGILYQCIAGITSGVTEITDLTLSTYLAQIPTGGLNDLNADLRTLIGDEATARENADNTLNSQKANQTTLAPRYDDATAPAGGIPAKSYYYHNGVLYYTNTTISQGTTLPQGIASTNGGLNEVIKVIDYTSQCTSSVGTINTTLSSAKCVNNVKSASFIIRITASVAGDNTILTLPTEMVSGESARYFHDGVAQRSYYLVDNTVRTVDALSSDDMVRFLITYI